MHKSARQFLEVHNSARPCTTVEGSAWKCTTLYSSALQCTTLHVSARKCTKVHSSAQQCTAMLRSAEQCTRGTSPGGAPSTGERPAWGIHHLSNYFNLPSKSPFPRSWNKVPLVLLKMASCITGGLKVFRLSISIAITLAKDSFG